MAIISTGIPTALLLDNNISLYAALKLNNVSLLGNKNWQKTQNLHSPLKKRKQKQTCK